MKKILFILFTLGMAGSALAEEATWLTSYAAAAVEARNEHKLMLLDFTGSDWCGWCMKLDAETLSAPAFKDYASENLVLVRVDFPRGKPQDDELKAANQELKKKYEVEGYPTLVITKPDGSVLWKQTGYVAGGPPVLINAANQALKAVGIAPQTKAAPAPVAAAPTPPPAPITALQQYVQPPRDPGAEPKLQGILYSASRSSIVLDGQACEAGETVHGMRIIKIARHEVTVEFKGQIKVISLN